jgi:hypothetical protein
MFVSWVLVVHCRPDFLSVKSRQPQTYTISATTNLASPQWNALLTTNYPDLPFTFVDTNASLPQTFYRVQMSP